ncbi:hypothetical protein CCACVL1_15600 [Corchorus capsularis]|uniref:Uncharacterized protein n=1 Tax=Corchorus capsularis TaxID=210143 RepID=A0A1R3I246_COCAP|nr:hypothetical protein CCACVL1_15600 [Corchorus capsularis]
MEEEFWHEVACGKTESVNMLVIMRVALSSSPNYLLGTGKWNLKEKELIQLKREAKLNGGFYVDPEAKL